MEDKREFLETKSRQARELALTAIASFGNGHVGGSMSIMDALAVLFYDAMRLDDQDPDWPQRDRLVMSKGHAAPAIYAFLCLCGLLSREELLTLNQNGTYLPSHCDRLKVRGIDMTAGSLGQGISAAAGMAKAAKMDGSDVCVYAVIGDGECQEGEVWEAALFAPHQKLDNLTVLLDYNKGQVDGLSPISRRSLRTSPSGRHSAGMYSASTGMTCWLPRRRSKKQRRSAASRS